MVFFYSTSSPFSQFHPVRFTVNYDIGGPAATGQKTSHPFHFTSAEQAMMFGKAMLFGDTEYANKILAASTPLEAKQLGRKVRDFSGEVWDQHKRQIVYQNNKAKFTQNPHLLGQLMATGDKVYRVSREHLEASAVPYSRIVRLTCFGSAGCAFGPAETFSFGKVNQYDCIQFLRSRGIIVRFIHSHEPLYWCNM